VRYIWLQTHKENIGRKNEGKDSEKLNQASGCACLEIRMQDEVTDNSYSERMKEFKYLRTTLPNKILFRKHIRAD